MCKVRFFSSDCSHVNKFYGENRISTAKKALVQQNGKPVGFIRLLYKGLWRKIFI